MKTKRIAIVAVFSLLGLFAQDAAAFYAPHMGRFLNRDPAGQIGWQVDRVGDYGGIGASMPMAAGRHIARDLSARSASRADLVAIANEPGGVDMMYFGTTYVDGFNLYQYTRGNPTKYTDPSGLACGSGWSEWPVPDAPLRYDFTPCCEQHDKCYAMCGANREKCDVDFMLCMYDRCTYGKDLIKRPWYSRKSCAVLALIYFDAVRYFGGGPYDQTQQINGCCNQQAGS